MLFFLLLESARRFSQLVPLSCRQNRSSDVSRSRSHLRLHHGNWQTDSDRWAVLHQITMNSTAYKNRHKHANTQSHNRGVIRFTSSPGCSSLSWTCGCPRTIRPGAWFLRVTMEVVGKVTWGFNNALCCWGWRTWNGKVSNVDSVINGHINAIVTWYLYVTVRLQFTSEDVCPGLLAPGWSWGLVSGALRRGPGLPRTTVAGMDGVDDVEGATHEGVRGSWLCWMKAAESGVSCLKVGRLLCRIHRQMDRYHKKMHLKMKQGSPVVRENILYIFYKYTSENDHRKYASLPWGKALGRAGVRSWALCTVCRWIHQLPVCPPSTIRA